MKLKEKLFLCASGRAGDWVSTWHKAALFEAYDAYDYGQRAYG